MEKHFVTFYSPGTFVPEETTKPIESWDVPTAIRMSKGITERHSAVPFGFRFTTRGRTEEDLDSKVVARSPMYYLGGKIETLADVEARNDPSETILRQNMEFNKIERVIVNTNSWKHTAEFHEGDILLSEEVLAKETASVPSEV